MFPIPQLMYLLDSIPVRRCMINDIFFNESPTERFIGEDIFIRAIFKIKTSNGETI